MRKLYKSPMYIAAVFLIMGWTPVRDYSPEWISVSGVAAQKSVNFDESAFFFPIARFAPKYPAITIDSTYVERRNLIPSGTILVEIAKSPYTACEMVRPEGHDSFYCFVDNDADGKFEGLYHIFSHSFFMISGWTNRSPKPIVPFGYKTVQANGIDNYLQINFQFNSKSKDKYNYIISNSSKNRSDRWVRSELITISPDMIGKHFYILGAKISVDSIDGSKGPIFSITPTPEGFTQKFIVQKAL